MVPNLNLGIKISPETPKGLIKICFPPGNKFIYFRYTWLNSLTSLCAIISLGFLWILSVLGHCWLSPGLCSSHRNKVMLFYCLSLRNYAPVFPRALILLKPGGLQVTVSPLPPADFTSAGRKAIKLTACRLNAVKIFYLSLIPSS